MGNAATFNIATKSRASRPLTVAEATAIANAKVGSDAADAAAKKLTDLGIAARKRWKKPAQNPALTDAELHEVIARLVLAVAADDPA
jgi:hypothetical protein